MPIYRTPWAEPKPPQPSRVPVTYDRLDIEARAELGESTIAAITEHARQVWFDE